MCAFSSLNISEMILATEKSFDFQITKETSQS
jgi:acyl carrier protein